MTAAATPDPMPPPDGERRDGGGRLVAVTWHGADTGVGAGADAGSARWLVAVDGSAGALRAAAAVARLVALGQGAGADLVHVQSWLSKEAAQAELARGAWAATAQARRLLDAAAIPWRLHAVMGEAAAEIVGLAGALGSLGVAIGSRGLSATESVLLGSVAYKVVHLATMPVLIVR